MSSIKTPLTPSVYGIGYLGIGRHKADNKSKATLVYRKWSGMLGRGYCNKYKGKNPTYKDVTVCEEWHNFQNFAQWFEENYIEGWHLDKDILQKRNKIYSPETCCFVPQEINLLFTNNTISCQEDMKIRKGYKKYRVRININKKIISLGTFSTPEEAFEAYKTAKEKYIREVADKWRGQISERCYQAMYNWL